MKIYFRLPSHVKRISCMNYYSNINRQKFNEIEITIHIYIYDVLTKKTACI